MRNYLFIIPIVLLALFRLVWLDKFPVGLDHDEIMYSLNGLSYINTNKDLSGVSFPLSIFRTKTEGTASIVPSLLLSLYYRFFSVNQFNIRLLYACFGLLTALAIYFFAKYLFKNPQIGFFSSLMFLANPWSFDLYRWCADAPVALLFYLTAITILLVAKSWRSFTLSLLLLILGFFSYQGAKPILLPIMAVILLFKKFGVQTFRITNLQIAAYSFILVGFFLVYFVLDSFLPGKFASGRLNEIFLLNKPYLSGIVDQERKESIQNPFTFIYSNKFTVSINTFINKYLTSFSTQVLFISGDPRATYAFGEHGLLSYYDIFLIPLGFIYLFYSSRKIFYLITSLILIAPLPTAINIVENSVINRSFMLEPMLMILSGLGVYKAYTFFTKKFSQKTSLFLIYFFILIFFGNFLYFYFFRFPVLSPEGNFFSERLIGKYVDLNYKKNINLEIYTTLPQTVFNEILFFNFKNFHSALLAPLHKYNTFAGCPKAQPQGVWVLDSRLNCGNNEKNKGRLAIKNAKDAGILYYIYNDQICQGKATTTYRGIHLIYDYAIDQLSLEQFCSSWVFKE